MMTETLSEIEGVNETKLEELQKCDDCDELINLAKVEEHSGLCPKCFGE